jgi:flagellar biosynthesis/type III secretory pathway protein FliH
MSNMNKSEYTVAYFHVQDDVIYLKGQPVARLIVPEGTLRAETIHLIEHADYFDEDRDEDEKEAIREQAYDAGYEDGYADGQIQTDEEIADRMRKEAHE